MTADIFDPYGACAVASHFSRMAPFHSGETTEMGRPGLEPGTNALKGRGFTQASLAMLANT